MIWARIWDEEKMKARRVWLGFFIDGNWFPKPNNGTISSQSPLFLLMETNEAGF
jgi:hypothetical protein